VNTSIGINNTFIRRFVSQWLDENPGEADRAADINCCYERVTKAAAF
jgi:hypothetical protein